MATRTKTICYAWPMRTTAMTDAVAASLGSKTLYIPETTRTFRSVFVEVGFQDRVTATGGTIGEHRVSLTLGAASASTITETDDIVHIDEKIAGIIGPFDFTTYFTNNFGAGTSQTCDCSLYFDQTTGTTLGMINVTATIYITYDYDDSTTTQIKTTFIPLESLTGQAPTSATEFGTNQVPQLTSSGFLPENSVTIRDYFFLIEGQEGSLSTVDFTINVKLDSESAVAFGTQECALQSPAYCRWIWSRTSDFPSTTAAHQFYIWTPGVDVSNLKLHHVAVTLVITYEFNAPDTTTVLNTIFLPLFFEHNNGANIGRCKTDFFIEEPGTITLKQSGVRLNVPYISVGKINVGSQAQRTYTNSSTGYCMECWQQRIDSGSAQGAGITLGRGLNTLTVDATASNNYSYNINGYAVINYHSSKHSNGVGAHNHTVFYLMRQWDAAGAKLVTVSSFNPTIASTNYYVNAVGFFLYLWRSDVQGFGISVEYKSGEGKGGGAENCFNSFTASNGTVLISESVTFYKIEDLFKKCPTDPNANSIDLKTSRNYIYSSALNTQLGMGMMVTYHCIPYTISGKITGYTGDGSGITVNAYRSDNDQLIGVTTTIAGGYFFITWYDDVINVYCEARQDSTHLGRSANSTAFARRFYDTFTDSDGTNLTAHTMNQAGKWTADIGTIEINSNQAYVPSGATSSYSLDMNTTSYKVVAKFVNVPSSGSDPSNYIVFRYGNSTNFFLAGAGNATLTSVVIIKCVAGSFSTISSASHTWAANDVVTVINSGDNIVVLINGTQKISTSDSSLNTNTKVGLQGRDVAGSRWDDFEAYTF